MFANVICGKCSVKKLPSIFLYILRQCSAVVPSILFKFDDAPLAPYIKPLAPTRVACFNIVGKKPFVF